MNQLKDIIRFKKELYFDGAVQIDWFYNPEKQEKVAKSFVFHGPKYFGISEDEVFFKSHKLLDTASFTNILTKKIYDENNLSNFFMTIAPYGTGKSHLSVTLASLFSGNENIINPILTNLSSVDSDISDEIKNYDFKANLVLVINGMKDFNLNYEILNAAQKALKLQNIDGEFLKQLTKSYDIAKMFVTKTYETFSHLYETFSKENNITLTGISLKEYLIENILSDAEVFEVINKVYKEINGTYIRWDEGVSAGDILTSLAEHLCGDRKPFNKVVLFFDEFGRFIEYASTYPTRAGDAALQQIYEAVQNNEGQIVFVGFIQSDLKSYLTRVDRTANINRYVGRYEASEKVYLSSNLETIFANLIERKDMQTFETLVKVKIDKNEEEWKQFHEKLLKWVPFASNSNVWGDYNLFKKVILEGIYPLHPLTSFMLSNLSTWLQQRSSLTFLENQISYEGENELHDYGDLLLIPATRIIRTSFFNELLAAEQEGRKQSEYCILYNQILTKYGDKLDSHLIDVLAAILITRIGRFKTKDISDTKQLIKYASGLTLPEINNAIDRLQNEFGVISYDETANVYDFIADAVGINDFKRLVSKKKQNFELDMSLVFDSGLSDVIDLSSIETAFGSKNFIKTSEWKFKQKLIHINELTSVNLSHMKQEWLNSVSPDAQKGQIYWVYIPRETDQEKINEIQRFLKSESFNNIPIILSILDDQENKFYDAVVDYQLSKTFSKQEQDKYYRFIKDYEEKSKSLITDVFRELGTNRLVLKEDGIQKVNSRISIYGNQLFEEIYNKVIPFSFQDFALKSLSKGRKNLSRIGRILLTGPIYNLIQSENKEVKNRIESMLFEDIIGSWGVINNEYKLISPKNLKIAFIFNEWDSLLENTNEITVEKIFKDYQKPPYGINDYALALLIGVYLSQRKEETRVSIDKKRIKLEDWAVSIFEDKGVDLDTLLETKIIKIDPDQSASKFLTLFKKVNKNNDVVIASNLYKEFEILLSEEEIPAELEDKVTNIEYLLKEGKKYHDYTIRLFGEIRGLLSKVRKDLSDSTNLEYIFNALDKIVTIHGNISDSDKYIYNTSQLNEADQQEQLAHTLIQEVFPLHYKNLRCNSIAQLSGFEKWVNHTINDLNRYGYREEASKLITKKEDVISKLNPVSEKVNQYITSVNPNYKKGHSYLIDIKNTGNSLIEQINLDKKIRPKDKDELEKAVNEIIVLTDIELEKYRNEVNEIYNDMYDVSSIKDCEELFTKIKQIMSKDMLETDKEGIEEAANHIQNFLNDYKVLQQKNETHFEFNQVYDNLLIKWGDIEFEIDFLLVLENIKLEHEQTINKLESQWLNNFIVNEHDVASWSANECTHWLNKIKNTPSYLSKESIDVLNKYERIVNGRLKELSVNAVVEMFIQLSEEEKIEALNKIKSIV